MKRKTVAIRPMSTWARRRIKVIDKNALSEQSAGDLVIELKRRGLIVVHPGKFV